MNIGDTIVWSLDLGRDAPPSVPTPLTDRFDLPGRA